MSVIEGGKSVLRRFAAPVFNWSDRRTRGALYTQKHTNLDRERHLHEAVGWLIRAQDTGEDRGVSYGAQFGSGFLPSYPETTGYIICTFIALARMLSDEQYLARAIEMGVWETEIQLDCGAVMAGMYNTSPAPAAFNTGMVLLGWASLAKAASSDRFLSAGRRAGKWLVEMQEPDGRWIRGNSQFANADATVYNVKAAWGLAEMGVVLSDDAFIACAVRAAEYALSKQLPNGWFEDCSLDNPERPLLHTIAYAMQGLLGVGILANRCDFIAGAARAAQSLLALMREDGFIPGRIERDFRTGTDWCCLTGTAQTSIVWAQLEQLQNDPAYGKAAEIANRYLMSRHDITSEDPTIRGGVPGSWPVWAPYGRLATLNWPTKFFADALLMRLARPAYP